MLAALTTVYCTGKVKGWHKLQGLTLNLKSTERVANYLYLGYTDPLELPPRFFTQDTTEVNYFRLNIWDIN